MQKITPFLWFNGKAEEAAHFYTSIFKDSKIAGMMRYGKAGPGPEGAVMSVTFELNGQEFIALNGGPQFPFTEAISLFVRCETQEEVDYFWEKLCEGGKPVECGWLKDKYGVSWQIVPALLFDLLNDADPEKSASVMTALRRMVKLDINALKKAHGRE